MKKISYLTLLLLTVLLIVSCNKSFLEQEPQAVYSETNLLTEKGIEGMLIAAYAGLDGNFEASDIGMSIGASNWLYGSILGGEAYKAGVNFADQPEVNAIMQYATDPSNPNVERKWNSIYDGVGRANQVLKALPLIDDPNLTEEERIQIEAESRFIRAFQHFEAKKIFGNVPYIDETVQDFKVPNTDESGDYINCWPNIEADFQYAYDRLDAVKKSVGRVNKWAAAAYLAKAYLFQHKFVDAKNLFDVIINEGGNSNGERYDLMANFGDNFRIATQNNRESVLEIQHAIDASGTNGYLDALLTYPNGIAGGTNSWFFRPSQFLVNAFRTDAVGHPLVNSFNEENVTPHEGVDDNQPFTPYSGNLDPRLDHSVGRRGIPYLDWGMMTGITFTAPPGESIQNGGAYSGKKQVFSRAEYNAGQAVKVSWHFANALNFVAMRFSDVLLMAAECEVEAGNLEKAREYVNKVRQRAANSPIRSIDESTDAANYHVKPYVGPWGDKEEAKKLIRFERRLELALEGHRFFDLVRWGIAAEEINQHYLPKESQRRSLIFPANIGFTSNRCEYQPIPTYAITQSIKDGVPTLKQNPGY